ncbi:hypothetical protein B0H63DRAFT_376962, partial [Podospora didyma]
MDPLSIAAGAAGLTTGCATIVRTIYTLIDDTVDVDENVSGLCDEVAALSRVLESVSQASISAPRVVIAEVDPDESLWITVKATLGDIKTTLDKLNQLLAEIQKASTSVFSRGFLRKPTKQLRFSMRLKDITIHRDRIKSYNTAMTSALQMINVCLMIQSNSSQDAIFSVLSNLRSQVNRVELALHVEHRPDAVEEKEEDDRISRNLRQFVRVAENFHSSASTIVGEGPRSTVWGGSILGDPLTEDQYSNIQGWIPPPIDEEVEDGTYSPSSALGRGHNSDSDDDIDKDLVKRLEELALESEQNRDFAKAENFYKKVVDRREASHSPAHDLVATKVSLAYAYLHQEKWSEAESIIAPIAWGKKVPVAGAKAYAGLHALALAHLKNADFESADRCCKRSLWGKRKLFGKSHPSYYETLGLLASICDARNDAVEAEAHRSFIPVGYEHVERDPLAYLNRATQNAGFNPLPQAQQQQPSAGAPKPELATRGKSRLIVAVHFGTEKCAVAFAFSRGTEAKEDIITEWPGAWSYSKPTIPTILYYDQSRRVVGWGCDIADALAPTGYPKPGIMKVEWFPLQLALGEGAAIDPINLPPLPEGKSAIDVSADYLFKLRMAIRSTLQKTLGAVFEAEESNISWCFTTQAVWSNRGRDALRSAIITAGYIRTEQDPRLMFVTEPEAAAFFCSKSGLLNLKLEDAVLVLECGKGTVDLSAFEVKSENPFALGELTAGSGDSCGSSALNRNFSNILRTKIRKMKLPDGSRTAGKVYAKSIMDFENRIKTDFRNNGQKWAVDVGIETQFPEADIDEGYMVFTNEEILQCFEPVVNRILELVRNQIIAVQAQNRTLQNILVTGEFGASEYLFQQIKLHVPLQFQRKVVRPMDSVSCIVKGAVTAGV